MNIAQIKKLPAKAMIMNPGLVAVCTAVYDRKTGITKTGDNWALQTIELKDDSGNIKAIVWNRDDLGDLKGKTLHLSALQTERGWSGCTAEDNAYQGKTYKQIKLSGNFLLEEDKPEGKNVGWPVPEAAPSTNGNGPTANDPAKPVLTMPEWTDYAQLVRAAHLVAMEIEPDTQTVEGVGVTVIDRSHARASLMATILIAFGRRDFSFAMPDKDEMPF
jgi:hypothetical protein